MKKILKTALTAVISCIAALAMSICVSAETEDVELSTATAKPTNGAWGQSVIYDKAAFDCGRMTPDTKVIVEFEVEGEAVNPNIAPIELILQNYSTADPAIWAKVEPAEVVDNVATFEYDAMVTAFGSDDFSAVDNMCIGDCGIILTAKKVTVTNCEKPAETTTTTAETTTAAETTAETTVAETEATEAETTAAEKAEKSDGGIPIVLIVVITVVVAVAVVVTIIIIRSKRRFY